MTGFARTEGRSGAERSGKDKAGEDLAASWTWEARSVNGKGLDVRLRWPPGYESIDLKAREAVARRFMRGNISLSLSVTRAPAQPVLAVNEALLQQLADIVGEWRERVPDAAPPRLDGLLSMRGVIEAVEPDSDPERQAAHEARVLETLESALDALAEMRLSEGARLKRVLEDMLDRIEVLADKAERTAALRPDAVRERLRTQVQALLDAAPALPEERLVQEAALLAAKGDVREELDRLKAHVAAARELVEQDGAVGRRLDFLCQEFKREANTLCSKSSDLELTRIGLDLKAVIEQLREQVQNVE